MTIPDLNNKITELLSLISAVSKCNFGDADRNVFRDEILQIAKIISNQPLATFTQHQLDAFEIDIKISIDWLQLLLASHNFMPCKEISFCINKLILDWDCRANYKIVVFTIGNYSINKKPEEVAKSILLVWSQRFKVQITKEPVFISLPAKYKDEVLSNIVLFHEVGHYVDKENAIAGLVVDDVIKEIDKGTSCRILREYFPHFYNQSDVDEKILYAHISEYFADLFAAQYTGRHILNYLDYLEASHPNKYYDNHPTCVCRHKFVEAVIKYFKCGTTSDHLLTYFILAVKNVLQRNIEIYDTDIDENDIISGNLNMQSDSEMMSVFIKSWNIVIRERDKAKLPMENEVDYDNMRALEIYGKIDAGLRAAISAYQMRHP